jgi:predicted nucleic acid-binding protein
LKRVFADSAYFIALLSADDALHAPAVEYATLLETDAATELVTTDAVLVEVLNGASRRGSAAREKAVSLVRMLQSSSARVEPQTRDLLNEAIDLYASRLDKDWGITDCMSILVMQRLEIEEALSPDRCFEQAGMKALLRQ